jgi:lipase
MQEGFRIILPSYPPISSMAALVDGLIAILDADGVEKVSVLAGSYGGMIAQVLVRRYRERVHKLILSTTSAPDTQKIEVYQQQRDMVAQSPDELVMQVACERMYGMINPMQNEENFWRAYLDELYMQRLTKNDLLSTYDSILDYMTNYQFHPNDLRDWHGDILILDSDNDSVFDATARRQVNLLYPQAHAHTFIGAGHSPSSHRPDIYFDIVRKFLHE